MQESHVIVFILSFEPNLFTLFLLVTHWSGVGRGWNPGPQFVRHSSTELARRWQGVGSVKRGHLYTLMLVGPTPAQDQQQGSFMLRAKSFHAIKSIVYGATFVGKTAFIRQREAQIIVSKIALKLYPWMSHFPILAGFHGEKKILDGRNWLVLISYQVDIVRLGSKPWNLAVILMQLKSNIIRWWAPLASTSPVT